jgi:DNA-binding GntR family transcriptional regulator
VVEARVADVRAPSASDRAYRHVKEQILDGVLPGGELISEGEIAEALGMSRTPVRAAFTQLESEGLLRLYPKRGALVVPVSSAETSAVIETRWVIERYAVEQAIAEASAVADELCRAVDDEQGLSGAAFVEADRAFHRTLVATTGNDILLGLYDSLRDRQRRMGRASARSPERMAQIIAEHRAIADAIAARDEPRALQALRVHLDSALAGLRGRTL